MVETVNSSEPSTPPFYRGRFAPTPSGPLHFGSLVTALASWLDARQHQGEWWLRIDDIDPPRQQADAADIICRQLDGLGLYWDKKIYQSNRQGLYNAAIVQLLEIKQAFYCRLSRRELRNYPRGHPGPSAAVAPGPDTAIRMAVEDRPLVIPDLFHPDHATNLQAQGGAFVIRRRDGFFGYHLACAVDDATLGMTHILRGGDLLNSTPQQYWLLECLGKKPPRYGHLPLIVDAGRKLSKSHAYASLDEYDRQQLLFIALKALGMAPPIALAKADLAAILNWGVAHWQHGNLPVQPLEIGDFQ